MGRRPETTNKNAYEPPEPSGLRESPENGLLHALESLCDIDNIPMAYVEIDLEKTCITRVNRMFCRLSGFSEPELVGMTNLRSLFSIDSNSLGLFLERTKQGGAECASLPVVVHRQGAERISCSARLQAVGNGEGLKSLVALLSDHPPWRQEDMERVRLKAAVRGSKDAVGMSYPDGRHFYHNEAFSRMFGYSLEELRNKSPQSLYNNQEQAVEVFETIQNGEFWSGEVEMRTKNGQIIHVDLQADGIMDAEGRVIALIGHHTDLTDSKMTVLQLAQSEAKYKDFVENAPIGMLITNLDGEIVYANKKIEEVTGYNLRDWKNSSFLPILYPEDLPVMHQQRNQALTTRKEVKPYVLRVVTASREIRWLRTIPQLVFSDASNSSGEIVGFQNFLEDITPTKLAIEEKERLEKQLVQSRKMEAIGTMAGGIAHDFNNILYPILGYAEMLKDDLTPESIPYKNVEEIEKSAYRARDLVQQILSFSRPTEQEVVPVAVQSILEDVLRMLRAVLPSTIQINPKISRKCRMILADPTQIHQVLLNLCTNAYHAMLDQGGLLYISLVEEHINPSQGESVLPIAPGDYARLTVRDTGCGISKDVIERIFEPYFTTKIAGEGTGLGLASVLAIVQKLKGHISVESKVGKGSAFNVYLPIIPITQGDFVEKDISPVPKGCERLLIVDDEEAIIKMLAQMLHRLGYKVTCFLDSLKACNAFFQEPESYDLVITDLTMPKMTGLALAEKMLKIKPSLPIILFTGYSEMASSSDVEKMGVKALLSKPANIMDLGRKIREVLDEQQKKQ
ncbi:PAS domain-containing sensor histidine kinase [Desulfatibacillum aliphaticivorans]|uniref:PAS domain-containing sensor histidine kinase n=1 Tax=Desulfatibacillum aliphaticivorans TaxID=218208 RepID=UPI0003FE0DD0|nr:PAS domain-containing sensor histidine kinase [Desulfatibacillum aliphaticivorans]